MATVICMFSVLWFILIVAVSAVCLVEWDGAARTSKIALFRSLLLVYLGPIGIIIALHRVVNEYRRLIREVAEEKLEAEQKKLDRIIAGR